MTRLKAELAAAQKDVARLNLLEDLLTPFEITAFGWAGGLKYIEHSNGYYTSKTLGQVSFHAPDRGAGPDYPGEWDGIRGASASRIMGFCDAVFYGALARRAGAGASPMEDNEV